MARQDEFTNEQIITALETNYGLVYIAAKQVGCSAQTIYNRAKRVKSIQETIDHERGILVDKAESKLIDAIENREPWAIAMTLKTLGKQRGYVEKQEIEHSGEVGIKAYVGISPDDWDETKTTS